MAQPGLSLAWSGGKPQVRTLRLPPHEAFAIGRRLASRDRYISTKHATVYARDSGDFVVTDTDSQNGTFVDGERVEGQAIAWDRSVIRMGESLWIAHRDIAPLEERPPGDPGSDPHEAPLPATAIAFVIARTVRAHPGAITPHHAAVERCLLSTFSDRAALVHALESGLERATAAHADELRVEHLPALPPLRPVVPFAQFFTRVMKAPPPFAIPERYVCRSVIKLAGVPHETMISSDDSEPVIMQGQLGGALHTEPGYFMAGFWGHGVNSYAVYLARTTERSRLFLRLPYGDGVYCSDPDAERADALAALERYSRLAESLPVKHVTLLDSLGTAFYEIVRHDGRVVTSPRDLYTLADIDFLALATR